MDLAPGDTFAALEGQLKQRKAERFDNLALNMSASIGSNRNASELAKHMASGEEEEVHKFAGKPFVATITIKSADNALKLYAIEALDIMRDENLEVHLAAEPRQFKTTRLLLEERIAYYVGDVNRTRPAFVNRNEPFTLDRCADLILEVFELLS